MTQPKAKKAIAAKVVEVDQAVEPIRSVIVGDNRNTFGRRLGVSALILLLLFFAISSYIQSAQNGRLLRRAAEDRTELIHSVGELTRTTDAQTRLIHQLQAAIRAQNDILRKAGYRTVLVPGESSSGPTGPSSNPNHPQHHPSSNPSPKPHPGPGPSPTPTPTPSPSHPPKPGPVGMVKDKVCKLTGICLILDITTYLKF